MDSSFPVILIVSILTVMGMLVISSIIYYFERDRRQLLAVQYWSSYALYFVYAYLTSELSHITVALGTLFWFWRIFIIRGILESTCDVKLYKFWHAPLLLVSFLLSTFFALKDMGFVSYTLPQALAVFIVGMDYLGRSFKSIRVRGKSSVIHYLLFFTIFIVFAHILDYPFYRNVPYLASLGFGISLMCNILMGIVLPAVTIHELKLEKQMELERLVDERSAMLLSQSKFSALGEMAAGIAHEINNPLGIISNRTSHLRNHVLRDSAQKDFIVRNLDQIEATSERMAKIINALRNFSKNNTNEPLQTVTLCKIVDETLTYCLDRFHLSSIKLIVEPFPNESIECRVVQVSQVLLNLLNNSFDAVVGTKEAWVKISFDVGENFIRIIVTDSGLGIPEDIRKKIMEPFFTTKELAGTGLGLSISRGIMEDHQGRLFCDESAANTRFVMELPYQQG